MPGTIHLIEDVMRAHETPPPPPRRTRRRGVSRKIYAFRTGARALGIYLRECRKKTGRSGRQFWSLRSVARRAEISASVLSRVERGRQRVAVDDLVRLAGVLGEDRDELLVRGGYLPSSVLDKHVEWQLSAAEGALISRLRRHRGLGEALAGLLAALESPGA